MRRALSCFAIAPLGRSLGLQLLIALLTLFTCLGCGNAVAQTGQEENQSRLPPPPEDPPDPVNGAVMVSQSVPTTMLTNGLYNASIVMRNVNGGRSWYAGFGYKLASVSPDLNMTWGINQVNLLSAVVNPLVAEQFDFQVRAPATAGTYTFQWRMMQDGEGWFGSATTPLTITVREPINNAQPWAQSVPTQMEVGKRYDVSVSIYNNGESTWTRTQNYTLMSQGPHNNMTWGLNRVPLPFESIAPDNGVTFTFQVTAPSTPGAYVFQWGMQREGYGSFGPGTTPVMVNVVAPPPLVNNAQVVGMTAPNRMITGQRYNVAVTMRNTGTTAWAPGSNQLLGSQNPQDNGIWGMSRVQLPATVAPGQQYTFAFQVTAPAPGDYNMQWRMLQEAVEWFGDTAGSPVTVTENLGNVTFIHTDGLGSPVARTDAVGNVISRTRYEPYGFTASGATPTIGFTGHVNDQDTGLTYMQQRYYDPVAGRFLSIDPVTTDANTGGSFNRYAYANNNPYKYIDPDGRFSEKACRDMAGNCTNYGSPTSNSENNGKTEANRHAAFREARTDAGITAREIPEVERVVLYDKESGKEIVVRNAKGEPIETRVYSYRDGAVKIQEHSIGHIMDGKMQETGHFNVRDAEGKTLPNTKEHYNFKHKLDPLRYFWRRGGVLVPRGGQE